MTAARSDLALKPCPFCGSEPRTLHPYDSEFIIECRGCNIEIRDPNSLEDAATHWNTRAASQPDREAIQQMMRDCQPATGTDILTNAYERGRFDGVMEYANNVKRYLSLLSGAGTKSDGGDWVEDFSHENGQYECLCYKCGRSFIGHKRRVTCKSCARPSDTPIADSSEAGRGGKLPIRCDACGELYSDHAPEGDPVCQCAVQAVQRLKEETMGRPAALSAPVGGLGPTIVTCCVTGAIPGDGGACGDCDPCIMGEPLVPDVVKRLIAEKNGLLHRIGELEDAELSAAPVGDPVAYRYTLNMELGQKSVTYRTARGDPFGIPGEERSAEYTVTEEPLYTHPPAPAVGAVKVGGVQGSIATKQSPSSTSATATETAVVASLPDTCTDHSPNNDAQTLRVSE